MNTPHVYEICIEGRLTERWSDWFGGLAICKGCKDETILSGVFVDQAALVGALTKIHGLNLTLISVNRLPPSSTPAEC